MNLNFNIAIKELHCPHPNPPEGISEEEIRDAEEWWDRTGQYSNYFSARLTDTTDPEATFLAVQSPMFRRDGELTEDTPVNRDGAMQMLWQSVMQNLTARSLSHQPTEP